ncbi:mechanosensitive ion channel family protein [Marinobacter sp. X15-166B]|uniref:mechanosensitive ion channel family protein n=1 Tax=Marinobacter sp. X15-166B TaxID=1897620 RepID=UPI00085C9029|nr:mechanosensitive ion channel domain-containing protein [Marinobacter sp. X15-166B]OEY65285.1 mechanosensitive ion channel protein MscS [Marinobacter sp. X15-166B]
MGNLGLKDALASLSSEAVLHAILLVVVASLFVMLAQSLLAKLAARIGGKTRFYILASVPLLRLMVIITVVILIVPILVKPTFENMFAVFGALALALGFAFKDYANSLIAGIVTLYEMPYRPGDWIEIDGRYGEVRSIGTRAAKLVTPDDTVIVVPHGKLWDSLIANGNDGTNCLMCVTEFHLQPGHDVSSIMAVLRDVAFTSPLVKTWLPVVVTVVNEPYGMRYNLKAYPVDPHDQFAFRSELTARGTEALVDEGVRFVAVPPAAEWGRSASNTEKGTG